MSEATGTPRETRRIPLVRWAALGGIVRGRDGRGARRRGAALTLTAFAVDVGVKTMSDDTYHHTVYPGLIHAADDLWYVLHSFGGVGAAAMMIAASLASLAAPRVPNWLSWLGVLAGVTAIVSFFFIPWFIVAAWLVVASVLVFRAHVEEDATF